MVTKKIKLFACDIDGTLTDGHVYVNEKGKEMKKFSVKDGAGFHQLKKNFDVKTAWITSDSNDSVSLDEGAHIVQLKFEGEDICHNRSGGPTCLTLPLLRA